MTNQNISLAILSAIVIVLGLIISVMIFELSFLSWLTIFVTLSLFYLLLIVFLLSIESRKTVVKYPLDYQMSIETPVYEGPVKKRDFVASETGKIYHRSDCRMAKMIKEDKRIEAENKQYFSRKGYKACKICL